VAILFPVFSRAREKARTASTQSNLRQMGLAIKMCISDWAMRWPGKWGTYRTCHFQIFLCPSADRRWPDAAHIRIRIPGLPVAWVSYSDNQAPWWRTEAHVRYPASLIAAADSDGDKWAFAWRSIPCRVAPACAPCPQNQWNPWRNEKNIKKIKDHHNDGANFLFYDSHAKWLNTCPGASGYFYDGNPRGPWRRHWDPFPP